MRLKLSLEESQMKSMRDFSLALMLILAAAAFLDLAAILF
jgi:hypothetical protein